MSTTHLSRPRAAAIVAVVAALALGGAACGSDSDSSATTTAKESTTSTTTTMVGSLPTVSEVYAPTVADSGAGVTAKVYLSITGGAEADSLVGVSVKPDLAASAKLTPESEVAIPATQTVNLDSSGTYIELTDLAAPLELNRGFEITLDFATAPDQTVDGAVRDSGTAN